MFDIGFSEIFIVAIVALLVLGPERLPRAARFTGLWVRRARAQWYSVKAELESELADDELKRALLRTQEELREIRAEMHSHGRDLQDDLRREGKDIEHAIKSPAVAALEPPPDVEVGNQISDDQVAGAFDLEPPAELEHVVDREPDAAAPSEPPPVVDDGRIDHDAEATAPGKQP